MREPKFTKGPWEVETCEGMNAGVNADDGKAVVWITDCCQEGIDSIHDAHLIAAAPELLEALEEASESLRSAGVVILADKYDTVIAKAYGETP